MRRMFVTWRRVGMQNILNMEIFAMLIFGIGSRIF